MFKGWAFVYWDHDGNGRNNQVRLSAIYAGLIWALGVTVSGCFVLGLWVLLSSADVYYLDKFLGIIFVLATFIGGLIAGKKAGNLGWLHGGMGGLFYGMVVSLLAFAGGLQDFNLGRLGVYSLAGIIGGVAGVNLSVSSYSKRSGGALP